MKKVILFFLIFMIEINILSIHVFSEVPGMPISEEQFNKIGEAGEKVNVIENKQNWSYVKDEWRKILNRNPIGRFLIIINDNLEKSKFIEKVVGLPYSFSFEFFFAFILWCGFFLLVYSPLSQLFNNKVAGFIGSFSVTCLVGLSDVFKNASLLINSFRKNEWIGLLFLILAILIAALFYTGGGLIKKKLEKMKEEAEKEEEKRDRMMLHTEAKIIEEKYKK